MPVLDPVVSGSGIPLPATAATNGQLYGYDSGLGTTRAFTGIPLGTAGQIPSQNPLLPGATSVGTLAQGARVDHVHPSGGLFSPWGAPNVVDVVFDGVAAVAGATLAGSVYSMSDAFGGPVTYRNMTVNAGITVTRCNWFQVTGTLTNNGVMTSRGGDAVGSVGGIGGGASSFAQGSIGPNGTVSAGAAGATSSSGGFRGPRSPFVPGVGGAGSGGANAGGASSYSPWDVFGGLVSLSSVMFSGYANYGGNAGTFGSGCSGGAGGGDGTNAGGGGGGGAGGFLVNARVLAGSGVFSANGGKGGNAVGGNAGGGGGGAAGPLWINTSDASNFSGTFTANAGAGGTGLGTGAAGGTGIVWSPTGLALTVWQ